MSPIHNFQHGKQQVPHGVGGVQLYTVYWVGRGLNDKEAHSS
jgi:hypothetical protein